MAYWKFRDFVSPAGNNQIKSWYLGLEPREQAFFDTFLKGLGNTQHWNPNDCKRLVGKKYQGLSELMFKACDKQHRVLGYFQSGAMEYVMLIGCFHKQRRYNPHDAMDQAVKRRKQINSGVAQTCEHEEIPEA